MTYTILDRRPVNLGSESGVIATLDITSYSTGGEDVSAAALGLNSASVRAIFVTNSEPAQDSNHVPYWDKANDLLLFDVGSTGAEVAGAVNLGTVEVLAIGG